MSGDVQPRKRKDKKRRKDEVGEQILTQTAHTPVSQHPTSPSDDVNIHVHKEGGTGGGICAKLVFFVLLSALVVVIGMIITQYRGLTDVDTVGTESKFSQIFEGWIDTGHKHDHEIEEAVDAHDHEEDDHDEESTSEAEDDEHEASDEEEEQKELSDETDEQDDYYEEEEEEEDEDNGVHFVELSDEELPVEESEETALPDEDDDEEASEEKETDEEESDEKEPDEDDEQDEDEVDDDDEVDDEDELDMQRVASDEDDDDGNNGLEDDQEESTEKVSKETEDDETDTVKDDDDESDEKEEATAKKSIDKNEADETVVPEEPQKESAGMAIKLGVGVALLVVAHLVLVRKWRTAPAEKPPSEDVTEPAPSMSRRNTIVAPPTLQEVEPDIEQDEEDYSDEEEVSDEETHHEPSAKTRYQELRSTYVRSLTPEGEIDYHKEPETYEDEYEEDEEVSEEEEDEEEDEEEEDDDIDSENEDYDDDEDEELLKRLEAKYGKLHGKSEGATARDADDSDSDKQTEQASGYQYANITNKDDLRIKDEIDEAQKSVQNNSAYAIKQFDKILQKYPSSPRGIYGKAISLDHLAHQRRSNEVLEEAFKYYLQLFNTADVPDTLFEMAATRCITRMRFVGQYRNAVNVHWQLIRKFPNNPEHLNSLAVTYLTINRVEEARSVLEEVLSRWPDDGFALVHYGFILKTTDNDLEKAVTYFKRGLETKAEGVTDGRFYFHLGDALTRLSRREEAMQVYEKGVANKVFLSKYQRSLYNVPRLTGKPWWEIEELPYLDMYRILRQNWQKIRDEGLAVLNLKGYFQDESENLKNTGDWKQFELFARGHKNTRNCDRCPFTCSVIERIPEARSCKRGQTKFSVIHPGTHVWPHCGPTNCRLRVHLGLKVPLRTYIRVSEEIRSWKEGEIFVFDDSFEHEVWHNGTDFRLVLIVDVWHPELTSAEKKNLSPI